MEHKCKKCGMEGEGFMCEVCSATAAEHDPNHACGGEHCVVKCKPCQKPETQCTC